MRTNGNALFIRIYERLEQLGVDRAQIWEIAEGIFNLPEIQELARKAEPNPFYKSAMSGDCWKCKRPRNICSC